MKFTISYYFTRCFETAYKIEKGDKILFYNGRIYCAVSPTYREQFRLKREREIRSELRSFALDSLNVFEHDSDEIQDGLSMLEAMRLSELITLRTQLLNSK